MEYPTLKPLPITSRWGRRKWIFLKNWCPEVPIYGRICIPEGYVSDGATVPRLLWAVFSPTGILFVASLVHDFAIKTQCLLRSEDVNDSEFIGDKQADDLFFLILERQEVSLLSCYVAYFGVRLGSLFRRRK